MTEPPPDPLAVNPSEFTRGRFVGSGSFGQIYLGTHPKYSNEIVLKFVQAETEDGIKSFKREIEVMRQATHPSTLSCLGFKSPSETDPEGLIVMDYMANGSLDDLCKSYYEGAAPPDWDATARSKAALGIAAGMMFLHSLALVHRDLKPANILVDANYEVRIADFGTARQEDSGMSFAPGTVLTQAPETYEEAGNYTQKVDVYSYAVCLYLLFTPLKSLDDKPGAKLPGPHVMSNKIIKGVRFLREPEIPDFYWDLITNCWHNTPELRPSFAEILQLFTKDRGWILEGSNATEIAEYQAKVLKGLLIGAEEEPLQPPPIDTVDSKRVDPNAYEAGRMLGVGANGQVFLGTEKATRREVVLKYVFLEQEGRAVFFRREVEVMHQMVHPATLSLIGWSPEGSSPTNGLIVMELMSCGSLEAVNKLARAGQAPDWWDATAKSKAVIGIVAGMAYVHALGLLHRDLKPENIFIDDNHEIRIADFGRARKADLAMSVAPGTALTQAPEAYEEGGYTNRIDVYSFGVTLYLMWSEANKLDDKADNRKPNVMMWIMRICRGARFVRDPAIPEFYWQLITACWAQAPELRPSFAEILQNFSTDRGWVFPGTDVNALRAYEAKVRRGIRMPSEGSPAPAAQPTPAQPKPAPPQPAAPPPKPAAPPPEPPKQVQPQPAAPPPKPATPPPEPPKQVQPQPQAAAPPPKPATPPPTPATPPPVQSPPPAGSKKETATIEAVRVAPGNAEGKKSKKKCLML